VQKELPGLQNRNFLELNRMRAPLEPPARFDGDFTSKIVVTNPVNPSGNEATPATRSVQVRARRPSAAFRGANSGMQNAGTMELSPRDSAAARAVQFD
jgi:hypothetical protein